MGFLPPGKSARPHPLRLLTYVHRSHVAEATQGVSKAVHQSYHSKEEAIVAYQVCLLKGKVELVNQKLPNNLIEEDEWECGYE